VGFYIAVGVVAALVGLGAWLWTPAKIRYLTWRVYHPGGERGTGEQGWNRTLAVDRLIELGPRSTGAFDRILRSPDPEVVGTALAELEGLRPKWIMPLLARICREESGTDTAGTAAWLAERISGQNFSYSSPMDRFFSNPPVAREQQFLEWWEREGRDQYAGGGQ
jgi:hypothetical protein